MTRTGKAEPGRKYIATPVRARGTPMTASTSRRSNRFGTLPPLWPRHIRGPTQASVGQGACCDPGGRFLTGAGSQDAHFRFVADFCLNDAGGVLVDGVASRPGPAGDAHLNSVPAALRDTGESQLVPSWHPVYRVGLSHTIRVDRRLRRARPDPGGCSRSPPVIIHGATLMLQWRGMHRTIRIRARALAFSRVTHAPLPSLLMISSPCTAVSQPPERAGGHCNGPGSHALSEWR